MKITLDAKSLLEAVRLATLPGSSKRLGDASVMIDAQEQPVVFVRRAHEGKCYDAATNVAVAGSGNEIHDEGSISVTAKELIASLKAIKEGDVTFEIEHGESKCRVSTEFFDFSINLAAPPQLTVCEPGDVAASAVFLTDDLSAVVRRIGSVVAPDAMRPQLRRMAVELHPQSDDAVHNVALFVAADGFRMAGDSLDWRPGGKLLDEPLSAQVPVEPLQAMIRLAKGTDEVQIQIAKDKGAGILVAHPLASVSYTLAEGWDDYPDWRRIRKDSGDDFNGKMEFRFEDFDRMTKLARVVSAGGNGAASFHSVDGGIVVTAEGNNMFGGFRCDLPGTVEGDERIALNGRYLLDLANALRVSSKRQRVEIDGMSIDIQSPTHAGRIKVAALPEYWQMIMPMYVQWSHPEG